MNTTRVDQGPVELLVCNLPFNTDELEIKRLFAAFGEVQKVSIAKCASGRSRRRASVWINILPARGRAGWGGVQLNGSPLSVDYAEADRTSVSVIQSAPRHFRRQLY
jgi:RNA recognition motif-containing protein